MTIENSEDSAQVGVNDPAELPGVEVASALAARTTDVDIPIDDDPPVIEVALVEAAAVEAPAVETPVIDVPAVEAPVIDVPASEQAASDSMPPMSRKLAPPPKPARTSGVASRPPSARPPAEMPAPDPLASNALKAPIAPSISYSSFPAVLPLETDLASEPLAAAPVAPGSVPPQGSRPPIPRRRSSPAVGEETEITPPARAPSDPALGTATSLRPVTAPPRPISAAPSPRPRSDPSAPLAPAPVAVEAAPASVAPPSSSAIFAMRIIAVGDAARAAPPPAEQGSELDPDAYPPSASRLGTGTRRSSRPVMPAVVVPDVTTATPPDVELTTKPVVEAALAPAVQEAPAPAEESAALATAPPHIEVTEELTDDDVSPASSEKKLAAADAEELGREDAISMPPEEVAAFQAAEAKTDPGKPPPPPKRGAGASPSAPSAEISAPPPTPDLAAAKAAQRKNTRPPWWEDLFNEDFMRASSRVSDEQIRKEVTFIEDSLGVAAGGVVLDLGCGAGHHAVEFASRGYGVVGYDLSLYQLALAADVAQERSQKINFLQGDMREMAFEEMFDGVFCWNTTFGYFEEDKNLAVAQRVFKALRPGGMFLIDVLNRDFAAASAPCTVWYEGDSCVCMDDMSVDYISSRLRVKRSIILDDGRTKESLFSLRLYSLHELGKLLHEVGFRVTEASGHPATPGVFFGPNSPRIIMLAQRP
jgi:SAM-dependent methyltransferase